MKKQILISIKLIGVHLLILVLTTIPLSYFFKPNTEVFEYSDSQIFATVMLFTAVLCYFFSGILILGKIKRLGIYMFSVSFLSLFILLPHLIFDESQNLKSGDGSFWALYYFFNLNIAEPICLIFKIKNINLLGILLISSIPSTFQILGGYTNYRIFKRQ